MNGQDQEISSVEQVKTAAELKAGEADQIIFLILKQQGLQVLRTTISRSGSIGQSLSIKAKPILNSIALNAWIEREFAGYGLAMRRKDDPPIPGEPLMSMAEAKELTRRAVAEFAKKD